MHTPTRNTLAFIVGFTTTIAVGACVTVRATKLGSAEQPHPANNVVIYRTEAQVPGPYHEIALLDATSDPVATSDARVYAKMRREAAAIGANAIILTPSPAQPTGDRVATLSLGMPLPHRLKATAILVDNQHALEVPPQ